MQFYRYPEWTTKICNHYWHLRAARAYDTARVRREYRRIEAEKKRLQQAGVDLEAIRLLCRHMVNLDNKAAEQRWWNYHLASLQTELEFAG